MPVWNHDIQLLEKDETHRKEEFQYQDRNLTIKALMKIQLLKRYAPDQFTFELLKSEYRILAVRGPRGIPDSLSTALEK